MSGWYIAVFALAVAVWLLPPLLDWRERRADRRDAQAWEEMPGATSHSDPLRDLAADLARREWAQPDLDAAKDAMFDRPVSPRSEQ